MQKDRVEGCGLLRDMNNFMQCAANQQVRAIQIPSNIK
jgi:hypothetical protein